MKKRLLFGVTLAAFVASPALAHERYYPSLIPGILNGIFGYAPYPDEPARVIVVPAPVYIAPQPIVVVPVDPGPQVIYATQEAPALPTDALKAYCKAARDSLPAVFGDGRHGPPTPWRCVRGVVFVCEPGADGVACSARSRSRVPSPSMVESCRDDGYLPVSSGAFGYVWRWECQNREPVIVGSAQIWGGKPTKFDDQGYAEEEWSPIR